MKKLVSIILSIMLFTTTLYGCKNKQEQNNSQSKKISGKDITIEIEKNFSDYFDLSRLPDLVRQSRSGEDLEKKINTSGINNVDINQDGNVDYINVEEFQEDNDRGFVLYINENNERVDLATIEITKNGKMVDVGVRGNPNYYGQNHYYNYSFPWTEILLAAWFFNLSRPRYFHSPYSYGVYPKYYTSVKRVPVSTYKSKLEGYKTYTRTTPNRTSFYKKGFSSGSYVKGGFTNNKSGFETNKKTLSNIEGRSFQNTTKKRPFGSTGSLSTSGFGSSSQRSSGFGSSSRRR